MAEIDVEQIMELLPHRYPFLLVDKVVECDDEKHIVGIKNVSVNEPFFQGHFPRHPIMPGVLQLEAMAQVAGILVARMIDDPGKIPYFMSIDKAKFRSVVRPGDQLRIVIDILKTRSRSARFRGEIYVGDSLVSEAEMMCMITKE